MLFVNFVLGLSHVFIVTSSNQGMLYCFFKHRSYIIDALGSYFYNQVGLICVVYLIVCF